MADFILNIFLLFWRFAGTKKLHIHVESLIYLSMQCKELKHLKITIAKVREEMDQFWKHTEGEIVEMFPNWNMEIRECEFLSYDVWFEQHHLRLD